MTRPVGPDAEGAERRRHERHAGDGRYLKIDGDDARLIDWSLGGLGVELSGHAAIPRPGGTVVALIRRADGSTWSELKGTVRRVQGRMIGVALDYGVEGGFEALTDLLAHRPAQA